MLFSGGQYTSPRTIVRVYTVTIDKGDDIHLPEKYGVNIRLQENRVRLNNSKSYCIFLRYCVCLYG